MRVPDSFVRDVDQGAWRFPSRVSKRNNRSPWVFPLGVGITNSVVWPDRSRRGDFAPGTSTHLLVVLNGQSIDGRGLNWSTNWWRSNGISES